MSWYLTVLKKYAVFTGRARRSEYWYFFLFNLLAIVVLAGVDSATGLFSAQARIGLLSGLYSLAILIPGLAVSVRRLHDTDRSGWWLLLALAPLLGAIVLLVFCAQDGQAGQNRYGPDPKARPGAASVISTLPPSKTQGIQPGSVMGSARPAEQHRAQEQRSAATHFFCTNCGAGNPFDAKFCHRCGALLFRSGTEGAGSDSEMGPAELLSDTQQKPSGVPPQGASSAMASRHRLSAWSNTDTAIVISIFIALVVILLVAVHSESTHNAVASVTTSAETGAVLSQSTAPPSNPLDGMFGPISKTTSDPAAVVGTPRYTATSPAVVGHVRSSGKHSPVSSEKSVSVHTLVDASACSALAQSDAPQEPITELSGLKIDRLTVYKADFGWEAKFEVANGSALGSSPNAFDGFCVSQVKVDLKLYDPLTGEMWHEQADASLSATRAINSTTYEIKEDTLDSPVVKTAVVTAAFGIPVKAAKHLAGAN